MSITCLLLILIGFFGLIPCTVAGQQAQRIEDRMPAFLLRSGEASSLVHELKVIRAQAAALAPRHPQFDSTHRRLKDLEAKLQRLIEADPKQDRPLDHSAGKTAAESPSQTVAEESDKRPTPGIKGAASIPLPQSILPGKNTENSQEISRPASIKPVVTADSFQLLGGWLLPSRGAGGKGLGFARGGLYVEHGQGNQRLLYMYGHQQAKELHRLTVSLDDYGVDVAQRRSWPVAVPNQLLKQTHTIKGNSPYSVCRPNPSGPLLTTGRVFYATDPAKWVGPWMNWYDESSGSVGPLAVESHVDQRQPFGGGFCTIPKWFAEEYLSGRDFGVGFGGYQSGQTSSPGPTLFVAERPSDNAPALTGCIDLMSFRWGGDKHEREQRPADYGTPLWGPAVQDGTGWWQADTVTAGPVWIDTPALTGLCYWSVQGLGDLDYKRQDTAFSKDRRVRLYVYDPAEFVLVVQGKKLPYQVRGRFYEWELPFDTSPNADRWPIGVYWDAGDQLLYLAYRNSGTGKYDVPPAVVVYQVK